MQLDVLQIRNQEGVFVKAAHPEFFKQYLPFGLDTQFHQHTGLLFEDPMLSVTTERMFPPIDKHKEKIDKLCKEQDVFQKLSGLNNAVASYCNNLSGICLVPPTLYSNPYSPEVYEELLYSWLSQDVYSKNPEILNNFKFKQALSQLAMFHALLQSEYSDRLTWLSTRSINRLKNAFEGLYFTAPGEQNFDLRSILIDKYIEYAHSPSEHSALLEAINKIVP